MRVMDPAMFPFGRRTAGVHLHLALLGLLTGERRKFISTSHPVAGATHTEPAARGDRGRPRGIVGYITIVVGKHVGPHAGTNAFRGMTTVFMKKLIRYWEIGKHPMPTLEQELVMILLRYVSSF